MCDYEDNDDNSYSNDIGVVKYILGFGCIVLGIVLLCIITFTAFNLTR